MTTGKKILIIDEALLQKIDELRGEMTRSDFIAVCIDTALEELSYSETGGSGSSGEEYSLLKGSTRSGSQNGESPPTMLRQAHPEPSPMTHHERVHQGHPEPSRRTHQEQVRSENSSAHGSTVSPYRPEYVEGWTGRALINQTPTRPVPENGRPLAHFHPGNIEVGIESREQGQTALFHGRLPLDLNQLWLLAILLFGFGDTLTSVMVFARGGVEANPLMGFLLSIFGKNVWAFVIVKVLAVLGLLYLSYKQVRSNAWIIPALASVVGAYLVTNNLVHFFKLS